MLHTGGLPHSDREGTGTRTQDTRLKRAVLYRLSYTLA